MRVRGVLIKPLSKQRDADGVKIDPAVVTFDPEKWYSILPDFRYDTPPIGRGKVSRAKDGSLVVDAELFMALPKDSGLNYFAFGGSVAKADLETGILEAELLNIGLTGSHADPYQPPIEKVE
jgi:hypothetical protein